MNRVIVGLLMGLLLALQVSLSEGIGAKIGFSSFGHKHMDVTKQNKASYRATGVTSNIYVRLSDFNYESLLLRTPASFSTAKSLAPVGDFFAAERDKKPAHCLLDDPSLGEPISKTGIDMNAARSEVTRECFDRYLDIHEAKYKSMPNDDQAKDYMNTCVNIQCG